MARATLKACSPDNCSHITGSWGCGRSGSRCGHGCVEPPQDSPYVVALRTLFFSGVARQDIDHAARQPKIDVVGHHPQVIHTPAVFGAVNGDSAGISSSCTFHLYRQIHEARGVGRSVDDQDAWQLFCRQLHFISCIPQRLYGAFLGDDAAGTLTMQYGEWWMKVVRGLRRRHGHKCQAGTKKEEKNAAVHSHHRCHRGVSICRLCGGCSHLKRGIAGFIHQSECGRDVAIPDVGHFKSGMDGDKLLAFVIADAKLSSTPQGIHTTDGAP